MRKDKRTTHTPERLGDSFSTQALRLACVLLVPLCGCSYNIDLTVPQSRFEAYRSCLKSVGGVCSVPAGNSLQALMATVEASTSAPVAIRTAPPPKFRNPFRDAPQENAPLSAAGAAAISSAMKLDREPGGAATLAIGVDGAVAVLSHPFQSQVNDLHSALSSGDANRSSATINSADVRDYVQRVTNVTNINGWSAYRSAAIYNYVVLGESAATTEDVRRAIFLEAYVKAYFRNGEFGDIEFHADDLFKTFPDLDKLPKELKDQVVKAIDQIKKTAVFGKIGTGGFVTRAGTTYQMPPLQITVDPTKHKVVTVSKVDYAGVGADLVRVVLEAMFDAHDVLPAVANATGVKANLKNVNFPANFDGLPVFGDQSSKLTNEQFDRVAAISNSVEGGTTVALTQAIRGLGPVALNNEALAQVIETAVGVAARKFAEKGVYCWYSCGLERILPTSLGQLESASDQSSGTTTVRLTVKY